MRVSGDVRRYRIITRPDGSRAFEHFDCGMLSWHPKDVEQLHCIWCHCYIADRYYL